MALKTRNQTRAVAALTMRGDVGTIDEKARTVEVMFSAGARVLRTSWFGDQSYEELGMAPDNVRMGRLQSGTAPFLTDHYGGVSNVKGVVQSARLDGGKGYATIRFAKAEDDPEADQLFRKVKDGIIRNISVGYRTYRAEKVDRVNDIPVMRATDWEPFEISAVGMGADPQAGFRSEQVQSNPCVFVTREEEEQDVNEEEKKRAAEELAKRQQAEAEAKAADELKKRDGEIAQRAAQGERERGVGIRSAARALGADGLKMAEEHVTKGTELQAFRNLVLDKLSERSEGTAIQSHQPAIQVGETDREKWIRGAEAGQLHRSGAIHMLTAAIASTKQKSEAHGARSVAPGLSFVLDTVKPTENGGEFRGMRLLDLARDFLEMKGVKTRGLEAEQVMSRALSYRDSGSEQTTSDFSVVLENLMYKTLLGFYAQADDTWRRWAGVDSVQDFRPANRYRLGAFGILDQMGENDEYKHKKIPDGSKQQISVLTYGNKIALSRRALINDDMGAVMAQAEAFGRSAGLSQEVLAYQQLLANAGLGATVTAFGITAALMDDQFGNINDTGSAISVTGLEADRVQMAKQKDPNSQEYLTLRPDVLLIPVGLEGEAKVINRSTTDPTILTGNPTNRPNIVAGLFSDIVGTPRLTGTRRYLFSRGQGVDSFKMIFLNGSQVPFMEQRPGWDIDGIEWKLRHDFNFLPFDPKGVVTNAGA